MSERRDDPDVDRSLVVLAVILALILGAVVATARWMGVL
jgi:hypothetical protein